MHEQNPAPLPTTQPQLRRQAAFCLTMAVALSALAWIWRIKVDWFQEKLAVAYPLHQMAENYRNNLFDFPFLLFITAGAFLIMAASLWSAGRRSNVQPVRPLSPPRWLTALTFAVLLGVAGWLSYRNWLHWGKPRWDDYWKFGDLLHYLWRRPSGENWMAIKQSLQSYPHAASPLTPLLISLLLFLHENSLLWLQILNFAATVGSLLLVYRLGKKIAPAAPTWILGILFLTNAATIRNSFFIQLDAISSFFILLFFALWNRYRERPTLGNSVLLSAGLVLAVLQKTTLFPLMAIPLAMGAYEAVRNRDWDRPGLVKNALWTIGLPLGVFILYLFAFGFFDSFGSQVELMGTGWNELDFSFSRFVFATAFLLGPYLPLLRYAEPRREPLQLGLLLFITLFFLSIVAVKGPFWSRYYSHVLAPILLLTAPHLSRAVVTSGWRYILPAYLIGIAGVQYAMLAWHIF